MYWAKELTVQDEAVHYYRDIDGIVLVYEPKTDTGVCELVGWFRPDGWDNDAEG